MTEIAGELEGSMLIEDLPASLQHLQEGLGLEEQELNTKEEKLLKGGKGRRDPAGILEKHVKVETAPTAMFIKEEAFTVEEPFTGELTGHLLALYGDSLTHLLPVIPIKQCGRICQYSLMNLKLCLMTKFVITCSL